MPRTSSPGQSTTDSVVQSPWKNELRALCALALPVVVVQVGMMAMGLVDSMMVGKVSEHALATVGLGNLYGFLVMMPGFGILMALDPILSQAVGARDEDAVSRNLQRGILLSGLVSVPIAAVYLAATPLLRLAQEPEALIPGASEYVRYLTPGVLPFLLFGALRSTLQAYHRTAPVVVTIVVANLLNAALNWVLVYGHLGCPPLGSTGSAIATTVSRWAMLVMLWRAGGSLLAAHLRRWTRAAWDRAALLRILRLGVPIGLQVFLEFSAFGLTLLMMGWFSVAALAGHQVAIQLASFTYMFPLGLSIAAGVRVGNGVGRGDPGGARWSAALALFLSVAVMSAFAVAFALIPDLLTRRFFNPNEFEARRVALALLPIAAVFQLADGLQVVCLGVLRGVGDTKVPMWINLLGFWCLGIPTGAYAAFVMGLGPRGLWWGLTVALTAVSIALLLRVRAALRGDLKRTVVDTPVD